MHPTLVSRVVSNSEAFRVYIYMYIYIYIDIFIFIRKHPYSCMSALAASLKMLKAWGPELASWAGGGRGREVPWAVCSRIGF